MTAHLLALTVGPVQEFISAARRTRDLWFGSYLLSEISKATAKAVQGRGATPIFPAPRSDDELNPDSRLNVANVIVAELHDGLDPGDVAQTAKDAAHERWRTFADPVFASHRAVVTSEIWEDQVDDVIEFYAAWVQHSPATYQADRARLMRLLAGRKRCCDFLPARGRAGVPKSSLDGLRESVLRPPQQWPDRSRRRLRLQEGEQLDVVALVKRTWSPTTGNPRYPSVARVAADPWLRGVGPERLRPVLEACNALGHDVLHALDTSDERGHAHFGAFPFEGTAVFRSRHRDLQQEAELTGTALAPLTRAVLQLTRGFGEPSPYLAVLVADGDRMGLALSQLDSAERHRKLSQALAVFASKAREVVHRHRGVLVYAGGDDVLAFVPVDQCIACARGLHDSFRDALQPASDADLTLSVGVSVAHFMEPLEDLLDYGRAAEKHAKQPRPEDGEQENRNALAVHVLTRGGGPVEIRANWSSEPDQQLQTLATWIAARAVSGRVAYDLRQIAAIYDAWPAETVQAAIQHDTLTTLKGKQPVGESRMHEVEGFIRTRVTGANSLRRLGNELLVARQIAVALGQAQDRAAAREGSA
jgi:CRISPR-associated protein Cmr2